MKIKNQKFKNEDKEREYWSNIDLSKQYKKEDFKKVVFPNLKPTTKPVSIRIPEILLYQVKAKANKNNIPYQSLIKQFIEKGLDS